MESYRHLGSPIRIGTMTLRNRMVMSAMTTNYGSADFEVTERLIRYPHAYPERTVWLDMWIVTNWSGEPRGLDGQALKWVEPARLDEEDILEADQPIVAALARR